MRTTQPQTMNVDRTMLIALIVGIVAAMICVVGLVISGPGLFFQAYLYSYLFWLGIPLGLLTLLLLHFLVSSRWGLTIRRIAEAGSGALWIAAVLFIPIIIGLPFLYPWARPREVAANAGLQYQTWYLNVPFFIIRAVIYFAIWILLAFLANRQVARLGNSPTGDQVLRGRLQTLGAVGSILILFTTFFASVDWLMSLMPSWVSTAFGAIIMMGQVLSALAFAIVVLNLLPGLSLGFIRRWTYANSPVPYQDLGALSITVVMAWAYVSFFQLLIQWAGNIPREINWYVIRLQGGWSVVAYLIATFLFALPFAVLLTIRVRHSMRLLGWVSAVLLVASVIMMFWHVKPAFFPSQFSISWLDIVMPFAIGGLWVAGFLFFLKRRPALNADDIAALHLEPDTGREEAVS